MALVTLPLRNDGWSRPARPSVVWRGVLCGVATLAVVVALARAVTPAAPAATGARAASATAASAYPYESTTRVGPWGFTTRHATDYVAWRFFERDVMFSAAMRGPNGTAGRFGEPAAWAAQADGMGYTVDNVARAGAVAQWNAGEQGAGGAGHVAYVERVNPDGTVVVSELDWDGGNAFSRRTLVRAPRYIHIQDL